MMFNNASGNFRNLPAPTPQPLAEPGDDRLLSRREASDLLAALGLRIAPATLAKWFCTRSDGPPVVHFGRFPRYRAGDLRLWARDRLTAPRRSSSEERRSAPAAVTPSATGT
jgi:hypothetical protein